MGFPNIYKFPISVRGSAWWSLHGAAAVGAPLVRLFWAFSLAPVPFETELPFPFARFPVVSHRTERGGLFASHGTALDLRRYMLSLFWCAFLPIRPYYIATCTTHMFMLLAYSTASDHCLPGSSQKRNMIQAMLKVKLSPWVFSIV